MSHPGTTKMPRSLDSDQLWIDLDPERLCLGKEVLLSSMARDSFSDADTFRFIQQTNVGNDSLAGSAISAVGFHQLPVIANFILQAATTFA